MVESRPHSWAGTSCCTGRHPGDVAAENVRPHQRAQFWGNQSLQLDREIGDGFRASRTYGPTKAFVGHASRHSRHWPQRLRTGRLGSSGRLERGSPSTKNELIFMDRRFVFFPQPPDARVRDDSPGSEPGWYPRRPALDFRSPPLSAQRQITGPASPASRHGSHRPRHTARSSREAAHRYVSRERRVVVNATDTMERAQGTNCPG